MKIEIGWIDYSKEDSQRVKDVIRLLKEPAAVDELGIGVIRDRFSDLLFPGLSTIQTRAIYFLIVPYLLYELSKKHYNNAESFISELHKEELSFIDILKKSGETGVIGGEAGDLLKTKPSDVYWSGIKSFEIFRRTDWSLTDYAKLLFANKNDTVKRKKLGNNSSDNGDYDTDDSDTLKNETLGSLWNLPELESNWKDNLTIKLKSEEAKFLRERITNTHPKSLLANILRDNLVDFTHLSSFDDIETITATLNNETKENYYFAKKFAGFVYGAHIRYNVILSKNSAHKNKIEKIWDEWLSNADKHCNIDVNDIRFLVENRYSPTLKFLEDYKRKIEKNDIAGLDELLIKRESTLKGKSRAKLFNAGTHIYQGWTGINKLQYRMSNAKTLCNDIFTGIGNV